MDKKIKEGYKKTKIGTIPEEWDVVKFQKITNKIIDGTHITPKYIKKGVPFLRVSDIKNNVIDLSCVKYISENEYLELNKRCNPEKGDILYSKNGTIGLTRLIDWDWDFSIFVSLCLIKLKNDICFNLFILYVLNSETNKNKN